MISNVVIYEMAIIDKIAYKRLSVYNIIVNYFVILKVYNRPLDFFSQYANPKGHLIVFINRNSPRAFAEANNTRTLDLNPILRSE